MALTIKKKPVAQAQWVDFKIGDEIVAKFLVNPIDHGQYQVAAERNRNKTFVDGFELHNIPNTAMPWFDRDAEATARYLLEDWEGIVDADGLAIAYTPEKAIEVLTKTDVGVELWSFIKTESERIKESVHQEMEATVKKP